MTEETSPKKKNLYQTIRALLFPIKPTDSVVVKMGKNAGFFVFGIFILLVSLTIALAVAFVL